MDIKNLITAPVSEKFQFEFFCCFSPKKVVQRVRSAQEEIRKVLESKNFSS